MKAGADQSQQCRHGQMGVAWWVWPCGCRMGLRDGSCRFRMVAASRRGQQQDFKLSPRVLAASLTAWAAAKSLSPLTLSFGLNSFFFTCGLVGWDAGLMVYNFRGAQAFCKVAKSFFFFFEKPLTLSVLPQP